MIQFVTGNQVTLLRNGREYFPALESAINAAHTEIFIQTYIFELDDTGSRIGNALINAASRGVLVSLLLDGFGCKSLSKTYIKALEKAGVSVLFFRPKISPWTFKRSRLRRMHRKMAVIDGAIGFVGGINIIDDYNTPADLAPRIDYAVKVEGAILPNMHASMKLLWYKTCRSQFKRVRHSQLQKSIPPINIGDMQASFLLRDNFRHRREIEDAYLSAIHAARSEIVIANAYFLPGLRFRHAMRDAVARGVSVRLLLQGRTEYLLLDFATRALYSSMLSQGIEIYEYQKSFMHSKVAVIDSGLAIVGSSNIDPFSLLLSLEANVAIHNKGFARELRSSLQDTIDNGSTLMTADEWQRHFYVKRIVSWLVYGCLKLVMSVVGNPRNN
jgi:cardiolipin synthase A/B